MSNSTQEEQKNGIVSLFKFELEEATKEAEEWAEHLKDAPKEVRFENVTAERLNPWWLGL